MKECPFSYSRAGSRDCQMSSCALWHLDSRNCSIKVIADILYSRKFSCDTCIHKKEKNSYNSYTVVCECGHFLNVSGRVCKDYDAKG